jgi:hypothetical protein
MMDKSHPACTQYPVGTILEEYWNNPYDSKNGMIHMIQIIEDGYFIEVEFFDGKMWHPPIVDWNSGVDGINKEAKFIDHGVKDQGSY